MRGAKTRPKALDECATILSRVARPMSSAELISEIIMKNPRSTKWVPQAQALSNWLRADQRFQSFGKKQWKLK